MVKIGLSGNKFAGKSTICNLFRKIGIPVFEADVILKFIISNDLDTICKIKEKLGIEYFGRLSRNGAISYAIDPTMVNKTDFDVILDCAEPALIRAYDKFKLDNYGAIYIIFKSSILFERGWSKLMDYNIVVFTPKIYRMQRAREYFGLTYGKMSVLLRNEIDDLDKNRMGNFVIHSYGKHNAETEVNNIDKYIIDEYINTWKKNDKNITFAYPDPMKFLEASNARHIKL